MVRISYGSSKNGGPGDGQSDFEVWKWMDVIQPYIKSTQLFNCPSDGGGGGSNAPYLFNQPGVGNSSGSSTTKFGSYTMNCSIHGAAGQNRNAPGDNEGDISLASLQDSSGTVWVLDGEADGSLNTFYRFIGNNITFAPGIQGRRLIPGPSGAGSAAIDRHLDTTNVLFCDGHVKAMKLDALARTNPGTTASSLNRYPMLSIESD